MKRNIFVCIILSIVTCGIYGLYWFFVLNEEINVESDHPGDMSGILVILLSIVTCGIYGIVWSYQIGVKCDEIRENRGEGTQNYGILFLILSLLGWEIINYALMQNLINRCVDSRQY